MLKLMAIALCLTVGSIGSRTHHEASPVRLAQAKKAPRELTATEQMMRDAELADLALRLREYALRRKDEDIATFPKCFPKTGEPYHPQTGEALYKACSK